MSKLIIVLFLIWFFMGCSLQGQKYQTFADGQMVSNDEWWSMRFLWMSNGIEAYTKTANYETGFDVVESKTDANSVGAVAEGIVRGVK